MSSCQLHEVEIVEVLRRSEHGITKPFICRGDNGEIYFVKGSGAGRISQINEWIAGNLAIDFGVPVAPFKIVQVPNELAEVLSVEDATALGYGPAFGSKEQQITELSYSQVSDVPVEVRRSLLVFDWWISNGDRMLTENSGNPNLFWAPNARQLVVIDHNQSFDPDFSPDNFFRYHAFKDSGPEVFDDLVEREYYTLKMERAIKGWDEIVRAIPEEWLYIDPEMTIELGLQFELLLKHLQRFRSDIFWTSK